MSVARLNVNILLIYKQTLSLFSQGTANAIAHNHNDEKDAVTVIWTPPSNFTGEVSHLYNIHLTRARNFLIEEG